MALVHAVQTRQKLLPLAEERRRFQRVRVNLLGRYMLADRREFPCQVVDMSPGGMSLVAPVCGLEGERVVAYIDHLGRLEGAITRLVPNGFAMTISATPRKRDKLAAQLTWLANRHILNLPEDRRHGRIIPRRPVTHLAMPAPDSDMSMMRQVTLRPFGRIRRPTGLRGTTRPCRRSSGSPRM